MSRRKTLYLANPYGFSAQQKEGPLRALEAALEAAGAEVWEPFRRNNQIDRAEAGWAWRIAQADMNDVRDADGLFAVVNGCPPDEGVMVELGLAFAWEKPVFLFRDDFRRCTDSEQYPLNLMVFAGLPATGWEDTGTHRSRNSPTPPRRWRGGCGRRIDSSQSERKPSQVRCNDRLGTGCPFWLPLCSDRLQSSPNAVRIPDG